MLCDSCLRRRYSLQQLHSWSLASDLGRPSARAAVKATSTSSVCPVSLSIHHCVNAFSCVLFSSVGANGFPHCRNFIKPIVYILLKTTNRRQLKRMPLIKSTGRTQFSVVLILVVLRVTGDECLPRSSLRPQTDVLLPTA